MNDDELNKYCNNKIYSFEIVIKNSNLIELMFTSYEEYKVWNENFDSFIKLRKESLFNIFNRPKFTYPK